MTFADRNSAIKPFCVMEVLARAAELEAQGHRVVHFEVGEPDFTTADVIVRRGQAALAEGHTRYTPATGIPELRTAIAGHYAGMGIEIDPERIVVTSGASGGLTLLAALLLSPGDELLLTDPGYPCNEVFALLAGGVPVPIRVDAQTGFQPRVGDLASAWSERSRALLLASPANPTGTMLKRSALREMASFVRERGASLIIDEIYQGLVGEGAEYPSVLEEIDQVYVLNSFSKYFGMTGWRLGWLVLPEEAVAPATALAQNLFICPSAPAQYAALAAFSDEALAVHDERARRFEARCRELYDGLVELGFHVPVYPDGAFYLYVDISHTGLDSNEFCRRLLEGYRVAVTPGEDFGSHNASRFVRFAFTTDEESIRTGLERIAQAVRDWQA